MLTQSMAGNSECLRPDRRLLNPKFDGYKLSSDPLAVQATSLPHAVKIVRLRDDVFSHLHVKAFGWTNYLVLDGWNDNKDTHLLYYVHEKFGVTQIIAKDGSVETFSKVFQIPAVEEEIPHRLNASVCFPSSTHAVISDGTGQLYLMHTGNRLAKVEWHVAHKHNVGKPFSILHSNYDHNSNTLACLLLSVTPDEDSGLLHVKHRVMLMVIMFSCKLEENGEIKFVFEAHKVFQSHCVPLYGAIEPSNQALLVASEKPFTLITDSNGGCANQSFEDVDKSSAENSGPESKSKEYTWTQENDSVTIVLPLPEEVKKADILFDVKTKWMKVGLNGRATLLEGELFGDVEADSCTWTKDKQSLEITLAKSNNAPWLEVIKGDQRGSYQPNGKDLSAFDEIVNTKMDDQASMFNQGQLEECDSIPDDILYMVRMDLKDGCITQKTSLSTHQWLFTKTISPKDPPSFCIRHDVDALVWQPHTNKEKDQVTWNHIGTLDAFGFVHASKKEQKFTTCSPDMSYAAICDVRNHVFTYHRHSVEDTMHAKQKLLQLDNVGSEGIIGVQACNNVIFVLAKEKLFLVTSC